MIVSLIPLLPMLPKRHLLQLGIISQAIHLSKLCNYYLHFFVDFPCIFTPCNSCQINKSHKLPFNISTLTSNAPLDLNFSHVWTSPILSYDNFKYYIIFVDSYTKYISLYPIKQKSDSFQIFIRFQSLLEKYFKRPIKQLFSDNGGEYTKLRSHLSSCGIIHLSSPPHTLEHNDYVE